jgi:hypothetical protein
MTDIGAVWKRSAAVEGELVTGWFSRLVLTASAPQAGIVSAVPLPRNDVGRRVADWAVATAENVRAVFRTPTWRSEPKRRYYHPRRESFIEDAAMSREMDRL